MWALEVASRLSREDGQGFAEYALVLAFVVVVAAVIMTTGATTLENAITGAFSNVAKAIGG
jgi:Flp pilus assembly pilin Flp